MDEWLSVIEAADRADVSAATIYNWVNAGALRTLNSNNRLEVCAADVAAVVLAKKRPADAVYYIRIESEPARDWFSKMRPGERGDVVVSAYADKCIEDAYDCITVGVIREACEGAGNE